MPELPEVETTARELRPHVLNQPIRAVQVFWPRTVGGALEAFEHAVVGARITALRRHGKLLLLDLARRGKGAGSVSVHLRMSGWLTGLTPPQAQHVRVRFDLGRGRLHFSDVRKFGRVLFHPEGSDAFENLGPEPFDPVFQEGGLRRALRTKRRAIKALLLDQAFMAGVGNIYADEALFAAGIRPTRRSDRITVAESQMLIDSLVSILEAAIEAKGSSFDGMYRTPEGAAGEYQSRFLAYGRFGQPCVECATPLKRVPVAQRTSSFCPRCQR